MFASQVIPKTINKVFAFILDLKHPWIEVSENAISDTSTSVS